MERRLGDGQESSGQEFLSRESVGRSRMVKNPWANYSRHKFGGQNTCLKEFIGQNDVGRNPWAGIRAQESVGKNSPIL